MIGTARYGGTSIVEVKFTIFESTSFAFYKSNLSVIFFNVFQDVHSTSGMVSIDYEVNTSGTAIFPLPNKAKCTSFLFKIFPPIFVV